MGLYFVFKHVLILSTSHDLGCPHSCKTGQKVPCMAPFCPQILTGALHQHTVICLPIHDDTDDEFRFNMAGVDMR